MTKKFDVVIGNPPYQDELIGDNDAKAPPVYHKFMDAAFEVGRRCILITPARFLSNAGQTPKEWNRKTLADEHLKVAFLSPKSSDIFPGTSIDGGIVITYRDSDAVIGPIGAMSHAPQMTSIIDKVCSVSKRSLSSIITEHPCKWDQITFVDNPDLKDRIPSKTGTRLKTNTFERMPEICHINHPNDGNDYVQILGLKGRKREYRWIRREYLITTPVVDKYKVILSAADGAAVKSGRVIGTPLVAAPGIGFTQTFIALGEFGSIEEAESCEKYLHTRFARAMLRVLKTTQHNPATKWRLVPLETFSTDGDIDWSLTISEVDDQLYEKYGLNQSERHVIQELIAPLE